MGSVQVLPDVCLDGRCPERPELQWFKIQRNGHPAGELLAAFILFLTVSSAYSLNVLFVLLHLFHVTQKAVIRSSLNSVCESCFVKGDGVVLPEKCDPAPEMQTTVIDVSVSYMNVCHLVSLLL